MKTLPPDWLVQVHQLDTKWRDSDMQLKDTKQYIRQVQTDPAKLFVLFRPHGQNEVLGYAVISHLRDEDPYAHLEWFCAPKRGKEMLLQILEVVQAAKIPGLTAQIDKSIALETKMRLFQAFQIIENTPSHYTLLKTFSYP